MKEKLFTAFTLFFFSLLFCCTQSAQNKLAVKIAQSKNFIESDSVLAIMTEGILLKHKNNMKNKVRHEIFEFRDSIHRSYMSSETQASIFKNKEFPFSDEHKKNLSVFINAMKNLNKEFPELAKFSAKDRKAVFKMATVLLKKKLRT